MSTSRKTGDYEVGFGKPPKHTRFKPGQSGNPRGRPKRVPTLAELVQREAKRKIVVVEEGERRKVSKLDALAKRLMQEALKGNARATQQVIQLLAVSAAAHEATNAASEAQNETDQALLQGLFERLLTVQGTDAPKKPANKRRSTSKTATTPRGTRHD